MQEQWATFTLDLGRNPPSEDLESRRDALAALLAEEEDVSGVEVRDGTTLGGTSDTLQLIVYTAPAALDGLRPRIDRLAAALNLTLDVEAAVRDDDDWRDSWKQFYAPIILGGGALLLRPSWIPRRPDDPEREIVLDPGRAFGTGQHESTRLCLDLACGLEGRSPAQVLDLGCGSGILAIAAARLFPTAERIVAVDVDPEATETTTENAELNDIASIEVITGTVDDVVGGFDLIFANIRPSVLIPGAAAIAGHLAPGGDLLVSGVLIEEGAEVAAAYVAAGLEVVGSLEAGDWVALHLRGAT